MSDTVSIELLLDDETERRVRHEWEALAARNLSSLAPHTSPSNRPHISVLVRTELARLDGAELAALLPLPLTLGAPLLFGEGERRVLARSVIPSRPLLELHAAVHAWAGPGDDADHTRPGQWTPHVTLARRTRIETLAAALEVVGPDIEGAAVGLRRWDASTATVTTLA